MSSRRSSAGHLPPDSPELADAAHDWRSAYVHIPFCRRRCPYCDFAVVTPEEGGTPDMVDRYLRAIIAEIDMEPEFGPLDAVNFGGGTPSTLEADAVASVLEQLSRRFGTTKDAEVSLEANPEDWNPELASALVEVGVNRVSLGVQSLSNAVLDTLGRAHRAEAALQAVRTARQAGVTSIGIDLIFGAVGETESSWAETVAAALDAEPDHISTYALTVELGTAFSRAVRAGEVNPPDADFQADAYEHFVGAATASGLTRYEVSNFAKRGHTVRYNLATWAQGEYVAFGLGAHGHREGVRRRNVRRLEAYVRMVESGRRPQAGAETISGWHAEQERVMLGLRRAAGVTAGEAGGCLWSSDAGQRLRTAGVVQMLGDRLTVTRPLLTDDVARSVLSLSPGDC